MCSSDLITESGKTIASGHTAVVHFVPPVGDLTEDTYFLDIDYYENGDFTNITKSPTIVITSESEYSCGEYVNVPIFKDLAVQIEIDEFDEKFGSHIRTRRTLKLT